MTGSTNGLGLEASRQLLSYQLSSLILTARSTTKGEQVAAELRAEYPQADIEVWFLEIESYDSIQAVARRAAEIPRLEIAVLNAGMQTAAFMTLPSGPERSVQVHYLSTMLLAMLLLPVLKAKRPARSQPGWLTIVSSGTARGATISFEPEDTPIQVLPILDDKSRP